jgi:hypothetical protein
LPASALDTGHRSSAHQPTTTSHASTTSSVMYHPTRVSLKISD